MRGYPVPCLSLCYWIRLLFVFLRDRQSRWFEHYAICTLRHRRSCNFPHWSLPRFFRGRNFRKQRCRGKATQRRKTTQGSRIRSMVGKSTIPPAAWSRPWNKAINQCPTKPLSRTFLTRSTRLSQTPRRRFEKFSPHSTETAAWATCFASASHQPPRSGAGFFFIPALLFMHPEKKAVLQPPFFHRTANQYSITTFIALWSAAFSNTL